jgi:predicted TIM-barrel fold metal-dependent hydrolase
MILSSDCHAGGAIMDYKPYLESRWHGEFGAWATSFHDGWADRDAGDRAGLKFGAASVAETVNWDSQGRLKALEEDGVVGEVLFPNTAPPFFPSGALAAPAPRSREEYERRWAGLRAHNRWMVDFCNDAPGRRAGVAQIFLNDVNDAIREIEWVAESGLTGGILLPMVEPNSGLEPLHSRIYDPIFAACAAADVPINHHAALHGQPDEADAVAWATTLSELPFFASRGLWHLIFSGVFQRHPNLKFIMTEQFVGWVPKKLQELDAFYYGGKIDGTIIKRFCGEAFTELELPPSEYFKRNCYLGASFMLPTEAELRYDIGVDKIMWGADYPHSEGTYPYSREALRATFAKVPEEECRLMLGETAARVYGFDVEVCASVADRVGPTPEEVATTLQDGPRFPDDSACFVFAEAAWA